MKVSARAAALVGGAIGIAAGGTALAVAVAKRRREHPEDPLETEPLGELRPTRTCTVAATDGVPIAVEEVDPADGGKPALTVVFVHGFALSRRCWHFQRRDLAESLDPRVRLVLYDQRSHGRSGRADPRSSTIDTMADDLAEVLRVMVPTGPIVLVGHSMGGMTIMGLAEKDPDLFADRIAGVALIATSAGEVGKQGLPRPLLSKHSPVARSVGQLAEWQPGLVELIRGAGGRLTRRAVRLLAFGTRGVSSRLVEFVVDMLNVSSVGALTDFVPTLSSHNRYAALAGLAHCRVLVVSGDKDRLTPFQHAERIAAELPDAELVCVPGAGHMIMLEQPELVTGHLIELIRSCKGKWRKWWRHA
jgi:pimeloyl-ACP methyl ester carboxylesterase